MNLRVHQSDGYTKEGLWYWSLEVIDSAAEVAAVGLVARPQRMRPSTKIVDDLNETVTD